MVGLLSSVGLGTWETWMSDSLQGLGVDWFVEQVGVGQLGKLGCHYSSGSWGWVVSLLATTHSTDGGVGGVLDHGLCLAWIHVSVSVLLGWWSGSHCAWIHPMVCLVVST